MDDMGYDYVAFGDFHFRDDLQYTDAVPMLQRLQKLADEKDWNLVLRSQIPSLLM